MKIVSVSRVLPMEASNSQNNRGEDYIPLSKKTFKNHFKMRNQTNQNTELKRSIHGDRKLYSRLVEVSVNNTFMMTLIIFATGHGKTKFCK